MENYLSIKWWPLIGIILALLLGYFLGKNTRLDETKVSKFAAAPEKSSEVKADTAAKVVSENDNSVTEKKDSTEKQ